jgi:hypothetical protein
MGNRKEGKGRAEKLKGRKGNSRETDRKERLE